MLRLKGAVQHYSWGRVGEDSEVARLYAQSSGNAIEEGKPYAELWMGTHPSGRSVVFDEVSSAEDGVPLDEWLQQHPEALGETVAKKWQGELPFLFKVLSIADALSIQAHPDKLLAERLHRTQPNVYKDPNHKPEMALALTEFEALCGFLSSDELRQVIESFPELRKALKEHDVTELSTEVEGSAEKTRAALKSAFTTIMTLSKETVVETVRALTGRLRKEKESTKRKLSAREDLVLILEKQFPDDVGVLASLFLNYIRLKPGQAVYLAANVPHAYISGDCVECMAASDNVVRAGLTPKYRDTETLSTMLTYEQGLPQVLEGHPVSLCTKRYSPPFDEFEVDEITIPVGDSLAFASIAGPSIFLVFDGRGIATFSDEHRASVVHKGDIFLLPAGKEFLMSSNPESTANGHGLGNGNGNGFGSDKLGGAVHSAAGPIRMYRARVNSNVLMQDASARVLQNYVLR